MLSIQRFLFFIIALWIQSALAVTTLVKVQEYSILGYEIKETPLKNRLYASYFEAPDKVSRLVRGRDGHPYVLSKSRKKGTLTSLRTGNVVLESDLLKGIMRRSMIETKKGWLVAVDYWPGGGSNYGGVYEITSPGKFRKIKLSKNYLGLSDIVVQQDRTYMFSDFESDNLYRFVNESTPEQGLLATEKPSGLMSLVWHPVKRVWYASNQKGSWPLSDRASIVSIDLKGKKTQTVVKPTQVSGLAWNAGNSFPKGMYFTNAEKGTVERINEDNTTTVVIDKLLKPGDLFFDGDTGDLFVLLGDQVVARFSTTREHPLYMSTLKAGNSRIATGVVANAVVKVENDTEITDDSGQAIIDDIGEGEHTFTVIHNEYKKYQKTQNIISGEPVQVGLFRAGEQAITGQVQNVSGESIPAASIRLTPLYKDINSSGMYIFRSNEKGEFAIPELPLGDYQLTISADGYSTLDKKITIKAGETDQLFKLEGKGRKTVRLQEPDNTPRQATTVEFATPVSGVIDNKSDIDWLKITVPRPGKLRIVMPPHVDMQRYVQLFTAGNTDKYIADKGAHPSNSLVLNHWVDKGDYFIAVQEWGNNSYSVSPYKLRVDYFADDGVDDPALIEGQPPTAVRAIGVNDRKVSNIWPLKDLDVYQMEIPQSGIVNIRAEASYQIYFTIYDKNGKKLNDKGAHPYSQAVLDFPVKYRQRIYIVVGEWGNNDASLSPYVLTTSWLPADSLDAVRRNDDLNTATPVADNALLKGNILPVGDHDVYQVNIKHPETLYVTGNSFPGQTVVRIKDVNGNILAEKGVYTNSPLNVSARLLPGKAYVDVAEWGDNSLMLPAYRLQLRTHRAETVETVPLNNDPVRVLAPAVGRAFSIDQKGDVDRFIFKVGKSGKWVFSIYPPVPTKVSMFRNKDKEAFYNKIMYRQQVQHYTIEANAGDDIHINIAGSSENQASDDPGFVMMDAISTDLVGSKVVVEPGATPGQVFFHFDTLNKLPQAINIAIDVNRDKVPDIELKGGKKKASWQYDKPGIYKADVLFAGRNNLYLTDNKFNKDGSAWNINGNISWRDKKKQYAIDFGKVVQVHDIRAQVDNNDDYVIRYSLDGKDYRPLITINHDMGKISGGMDRFSTREGDEHYQPGLAFDPVKARFLQIQAVSGDGYYSVGELQALDANGRVRPALPVSNNWEIHQSIWVDARTTNDNLGLQLSLDGLDKDQVLEKQKTLVAHVRPSKGAEVQSLQFKLDGKVLKTLYNAPFEIDLPWDALDDQVHQFEVSVTDTNGERKRIAHKFRLADYFGLSPENQAQLTGENVRVSWMGNAFGKARVRYREVGTRQWKTVVGENGRHRSVVLGGLTAGKRYEYQLLDLKPDAPIRSFELLKGLAFGQASYGAVVARDYDQRLAVTVRNNGEEALVVKLDCGKPADSRLLVGFVGDGSADRPFKLAAGEERKFMLGISAQDVVTEQHSFPIRILSKTGLADEAMVNLSVRIPKVRLKWKEMGRTKDGMGLHMRLTNRGDKITDLKIFSMQQDVEISPAVNHGMLRAGASIDVVVRPRLDRGLEQVKTTLVAQGMDKQFTHKTNIGAQEGESAYKLLLIPAIDPALDPIEYDRQLENNRLAELLNPDNVNWENAASKKDLDGDGKVDRWEVEDHLDNVIWVGDDTDSDGKVDFVHADISMDGIFNYSAYHTKTGWQKTNLVEAWLEMGFSLPWSRASYRKHDVDIIFNNEVIGRLRDTIPNGNYSFRIPPYLVKFNAAGEPEDNHIGIQSKHLRGGHYVVNSDFRLSFRLTGTPVWSAGTDLADAYQKVTMVDGLTVSAPDYSVSSQHFDLVHDAELEADKTYQLKARLYNLGSVSPGPVEVALLDKKERHKTKEITRTSLDNIPMQGVVPVTLPWKATPGEHHLIVQIDPDRVSGDLELVNNRAELTVQVPGDPEPPSLQIIKPGNNEKLLSPTSKIEVRAIDETELATVEASIDGGLWEKLPNIKGDRFSAKLLLQPGQHRIQVRAIDGSGNQTLKEHKVMVTARAANSKIIFPENNARIPVRATDVILQVPKGTRYAAARIEGRPWYKAQISYRTAKLRLPLPFGSQTIEVLTIDDRGVSSTDAIKVTGMKQPLEGEASSLKAKASLARFYLDKVGYIDVYDGLNAIIVDDETGEQ